MIKVILDTDPGIDDALAILLLATLPEVDLQAITVTHGNTTVDKCLANALKIATLAGLDDVPIARGAAEPLIQKLTVAEETHGDTGLGYAVLPNSSLPVAECKAFELMIDLIHRHPHEITVLCIGPMTNLATAILNDPTIIPLIKNVDSMAGSFEFAGNASPTAEYNVFCDPEAYQIVVNSGIPLSIVPLDVTYQCIFTTDHLERLKNIKPAVREFIADSTRFYMEFHDEYQSIQGCAINDPLAAALLVKPDLVSWNDFYVSVELSGESTRAKTSADRFNTLSKKPNARVAMTVQVEKFMDFFIDQMGKL
jgi:inosine-uridine nucleoside N-ribohydrolase